MTKAVYSFLQQKNNEEFHEFMKIVKSKKKDPDISKSDL